MKPEMILLTAAMILTAGCQVAPQPTPVITKLHTVSIHVKDHQVHEGVYRFLREDLQLPQVYELVTQGGRRYVGLWAGNLVLEPCGPYANITYATPEFGAIFCGLTFEAYQSAQQSAEQLGHRQIKYKSLGTSFVIINDPNLCEGNLVASIMDNPGRVQERQKHEALTSQLKENQGGPLGLQYVSKIEVGYTHRKDIDAWETLLTPARQVDPYQWQLSDGPALRLVKSPRKEIKAVVFKVNSLEAATHYLRTNDLLGRVNEDRVQVKAPDHWEFNIVLQE
jgi:hypothetical protein